VTGRASGVKVEDDGGGPLISPDGVILSRMVVVSASVVLPSIIKVQKISSGTGSPGWSRKKGRKMVRLCVFVGHSAVGPVVNVDVE